VHEGVLKLRDYKWNLKNWDRVLLATQYFRVSSSGGAREKFSMGEDGTLVQSVPAHACPATVMDGGGGRIKTAGTFSSFHLDRRLHQAQCQKQVVVVMLSISTTIWHT